MVAIFIPGHTQWWPCLYLGTTQWWPCLYRGTLNGGHVYTGAHTVMATFVPSHTQWWPCLYLTHKWLTPQLHSYIVLALCCASSITWQWCHNSCVTLGSFRGTHTAQLLCGTVMDMWILGHTWWSHTPVSHGDGHVLLGRTHTDPPQLPYCIMMAMFLSGHTVMPCTTPLSRYDGLYAARGPQ